MSDLIVDANVLKSAGESFAIFSVTARNVLDLIQRNSICILVDKFLYAEWQKHLSKYATKWLSLVASRQQMVIVSSGCRRSAEIRDAIGSLCLAEQESASKDLHIIESALAYGAVVVSFEKNCRDIFCRLISRYEPIADVIWVSPIERPEIDEFLNSGCGGIPPSRWALLARR